MYFDPNSMNYYRAVMADVNRSLLIRHQWEQRVNYAFAVLQGAVKGFKDMDPEQQKIVLFMTVIALYALKKPALDFVKGASWILSPLKVIQRLRDGSDAERAGIIASTVTLVVLGLKTKKLLLP